MIPRLFVSILLTITISIAVGARTQRQAPTTSHPDFAKIKVETLNPESPYYYNTLLSSFLSNDTTMTDDEYHYFYYGTMFQEDYNPYRPYPFQAQLRATEPLYFKHGNLSRSEKDQILRLAQQSLNDNPLNLTQLMYRVYVYEQNGKYNLAQIWKHKLDHLLLTIARSGTGLDPEHAWVIVYPSHEFDYFNLSGISVESQEFQQPYYEKVTVHAPGTDKPREYYFDLHHLLEQYYLKHPSDDD